MSRIGTLFILCIGLLGSSADSSVGADDPPVKGSPKLQRIADAHAGHVHPAICLTRSGDVLVAHFAEAAGRIHLVRSSDGGRSWKDAGKLLDIGGQPYPGALNRLSDGRILLTWNIWADPKDHKKGRRPYFATSADDGRTWTRPRKLPIDDDFHGYVRHAIWERSPSEWIIPMGNRVVSYDPTTDKVKPFGPKQSCGPLVRTKKGTLLLAAHRSTDQGKTWTPIMNSPLMGAFNADLLALDNGWVVAMQPIPNGQKLVLSYDDGVTWTLNRPLTILEKDRMLEYAWHLGQLDADHLGLVGWDANGKQPGGIGVYFMRMKLDELRNHTTGSRPSK